MVTTTSKKLTQLLRKLKIHSKHQQYDTASSSSSLSFYPSEFSQNSSMGGSSDFQGFEDDNDDDCGVKDVPAGSLPVYVGPERRRFVIPTRYLSNSIFRALLAKSEEEFGFRCDGGLRIACAPEVFEHFLWWLEGDGAAHCNI